MSATWKQYEGQAVDGIPLLRLLGGSDASAVYGGELAGKPCAIKLVSVKESDVQPTLARWQQASKLSHPNLTAIEQWGRAKLNGQQLAYLAMEYAEEVLASVDRPLTAKEAREMLTPAVSALAYLHSKGLAHGRIKPSNILSAGEVLKVSGDAPMRIGEKATTSSPYDAPELGSTGVTPAADAWSLGIALAEAMTKQLPKVDAAGVTLPDSLRPESFRDVAIGLLDRDVTRRWTIHDLQQWLERGIVPVPKPGKKPYAWIAAAAGVVVIGGVLAWPYITGNGSSVAPAASTNPPAAAEVSPAPPPVEQPQAAVSTPPPPEPVKAPPAKPQPPPVAAEPAPKTAGTATQSAPIPDATPVTPAPTVATEVSTPGPSDSIPSDVLQPVKPQILAKARATIHGKVLVYIRIDQDATGAVTDAKIESGASSKYFANAAVAAARQWKFAPSDGPHSWRVRFEFTHSGENPVSIQANKTQ